MNNMIFMNYWVNLVNKGLVGFGYVDPPQAGKDIAVIGSHGQKSVLLGLPGGGYANFQEPAHSGHPPIETGTHPVSVGWGEYLTLKSLAMNTSTDKAFRIELIRIVAYLRSNHNEMVV